MSLNAAAKAEIVAEHQLSTGDTGSPEVQVALWSAHVDELSAHLKLHPKDHASRRGLLALVMRRRSLLKYLKSKSLKRYLDLISKLGLRH